MKKLIILGALAPFLLTGPAFAGYCGRHDGMVSVLKEKYKEERKNIAISQDGTKVIEVFTSPGGKTWSILMTQGETTCVIGSGTDWMEGSSVTGKEL